MNFVVAKKTLIASLNDIDNYSPPTLSEEMQSQIDSIINGNHLTFKYIFITALLAKVVSPNIHMRSLQAQADLDGAYDARSLCHKVWVPFEEEYLNGRLGKSNEPFLNKPARFPAIELTNAVRAGNDKRLLELMYSLLEKLNDSGAETVNEAFMYAMKLIWLRPSSLASEIELPETQYTYDFTWDILDSLLANCFGGQSAVAVAGALFRTLMRGRKIVVHPANQAGSSSKEVGDIDIFEKGQIYLPVEVKDKVFIAKDVQHAVGKVVEAKYNSLMFLRGRHAAPSEDIVLSDCTPVGFDLSMIELDQWVQNHIAYLPEQGKKALLFEVAETMDQMRATDEIKAFYKTLVD
jgi:hypothetical protein